VPPTEASLANIRSVAETLGIALIGESTAFLRLLESIQLVARHAHATVLIRGETGTGKELVARSIHYLGPRSRFPFVPVNCGALPETLAERELFGHRAGAFTGATHESEGLLRFAHNGTLFLDEVDSLPPRAQGMLLRFLQDGTFRPLGGVREERSSVRILAASNRDLPEHIAGGHFREDLYHRLNVLNVVVPPLRLRAGDAGVLARHFLQACAERYRMPPKQLDERTLSWFEGYRWPGNVRELENLIHREFLQSEQVELRIEPPGEIAALAQPPSTAAPRDYGQMSYRKAKSIALENFDRAYLAQLLERSLGNVTRAAELAGKERRALGKLLKRYQISRIDDPASKPPT
jgi:transcriptional regulator with GAF, ATPase, and Fis domain